jgi:putative membrane protein
VTFFFRRITTFTLGAYAFSTTLAILSVLGILPTQFPFTPVNTILAFLFGLLHGGQRLGWKQTIFLAVLVFLTGLTFESIGVATGFIYGPYHYTDNLGPKFLGLVPYLIPIAWFMMIYPSFVIAGRLIPARSSRFTRIILVAIAGGMIMTAWDLGMDPLMVRAGYWVWDINGAYFGVPVQNFWGWWLTTFVALTIFQLVNRQSSEYNSKVIPDLWVVILYAITGLSTVILDFLIGLPGPGLVGLFVMAPWVIAASTLRQSSD